MQAARGELGEPPCRARRPPPQPGSAGRCPGRVGGIAALLLGSHRSGLFPPGMFYLFLSRFVLLHPPSLAFRSAAFCFLRFRRVVFSPRFAAFSPRSRYFFGLTPRAHRPRSVWPARRKRFRGSGGAALSRSRAPAFCLPREGSWRRGRSGTGRSVLSELSSLSHP